MAVDTPVYVPEAQEPRIQIVTGPMPGNAFEYLVTHSIHRVSIDGSGLRIIFEQPPGEKTTQWVNGFQIVPVPEAHTGFFLGTVMLGMIARSWWRPQPPSNGPNSES
ncbi:MAG: hypothetical protein ACR2HJ_03800 [Fimbriimonadales bacterium]